jgi:hypothetical protein
MFGDEGCSVWDLLNTIRMIQLLSLFKKTVIVEGYLSMNNMYVYTF